MSRANLANFNHRVHRDWHRVAQRKNIKKNQDGFSLRFLCSNRAMGFNPQPLKNQDGFSLRFFNSNGAGGFNPCDETDF
jgi:hypothetical protein